jgi:hypothetical protein
VVAKTANATRRLGGSRISCSYRPRAIDGINLFVHRSRISHIKAMNHQTNSLHHQILARWMASLARPFDDLLDRPCLSIDSDAAKPGRLDTRLSHLNNVQSVKICNTQESKKTGMSTPTSSGDICMCMTKGILFCPVVLDFSTAIGFHTAKPGRLAGSLGFSLLSLSTTMSLHFPKNKSTYTTASAIVMQCTQHQSPIN